MFFDPLKYKKVWYILLEWGENVKILLILNIFEVSI